MSLPYSNITGWENATDIIPLVTVTNQATDGYVGSLIFFSVFLIFLLALLQRYDAAEATFGAGLVSGFAGLIFLWIGWVTVFPILVSLIATVLGLLAMYTK